MAKARPTYTPAQLGEARRWVERLDLTVGQAVPEPPWGDRREDRGYWLAMHAALAERGLAGIRFEGGPLVILPAEDKDPDLWAIIRGLNDEENNANSTAATAAVILDYLRDHHGIEPGPDLRAWAAGWQQQRQEQQRQAAMGKAREVALAGMPDDKVQRLAQLLTGINAGHNDIVANLRRTLELARQVGDYLLEAKRLVGHGGWGRWLNLAREGGRLMVQDRECQRYMRIAESWDELLARAEANASRVSDLSIRGALRLLAEPSEDYPDASDSAEDLATGADASGVLEALEAAAQDPTLKSEAEALRSQLQHQEAALQATSAEVEQQEAEAREGRRRRRQLEAEELERRQEAQRQADQEAREAAFDLDRALEELVEELRRLRDWWPEGQRQHFIRAAGRALRRLGAADPDE